MSLEKRDDIAYIALVIGANTVIVGVDNWLAVQVLVKASHEMGNDIDGVSA